MMMMNNPVTASPSSPAAAAAAAAPAFHDHEEELPPEDEEEGEDDESSASSSSLDLEGVSNHARGQQKKRGGNLRRSSLYTEVEVAPQEDKWVWRMRVITVLVLVAVSLTVCLVTWSTKRSAETRAFEDDFTDLGSKMVTSFGKVVQQRFGIIQGFAQTITSDANVGTRTTAGSNSSAFPFVTPPNFAYRVETVAALAQVMFLIYLPRVQLAQMEDWNAYALANTHWIAQGLEHQAAQEGKTLPPPVELEPPFIFPTIMNVHNPNGPTPALNITPDHTEFYPIWCNWPLSPEGYSGAMVDMGGDIEHEISIEQTLTKGIPTFEISSDYIDPTKKENDAGRYNMLISSPYVEYRDDPHGVAFFPVFDSMDDTENNNVRPKKVAGLILCIVYWRTYFDDLLPPGANGIFVILENDCQQQYTYKIDGTYAQFLGHGDLHDPKYDYLEAKTSIDDIIVQPNKDQDEGSEEPFSTTTTSANTNEFVDCHYSIRVYPSEEFENDHRTNEPWVFAIVLACLFLFVTGIYALYDYCVQKRQAIVLQSAQQSGKLVNTLFPKNVRDELYREQQEKVEQQQMQNSWHNNNQSSNHNNNNNKPIMSMTNMSNRISNATTTSLGTTNNSSNNNNKNHESMNQQLFQATDNNQDLLSSTNTNPPPIASSSGTTAAASGGVHKKAIASLYENSSIYFADLVGFTAWSGKRTPEEVFQLLETLYGVFDDIATKRNVYKIETIGDCYVAATGLPEPQDDHAVIMCKFATDCMNKFATLTANLADALGEDTALLAMRVGIHSGKVTAGVLRGQKSRFQLFGDTVNVAARMESNGVPNRIHVSQQTADVLVAKGKGSWLTPRPDKIVAKGKGELQTYFVDTSRKSKSATSSSGIDASMADHINSFSTRREEAPAE